MQGHSSGETSCKLLKKFHMDGQTVQYHIGPSHDYRSIVEEVPSQEESAVKKGGQACFFTAVDTMNIPMLTPRFIENDPRMIPYTMTVQNTVELFDVKIAQNKSFGFDQSKSTARALYNTMPAESLVKVVKRNKDDSQARSFIKRRTRCEVKSVVFA